MPQNPEMAMNFQLDLFTSLNLFHTKGNRTINETNILMAPTWFQVYTSRPFFIRIKELPQMMARRVISAKEEDVLVVVVGIVC